MKVLKFLSGIVLAFAIASVALFIESILPIHIIGAAVMAMLIGMIINYFIGKKNMFSAGYSQYFSEIYGSSC